MSSNIYPALAIRPRRFAEMDFLMVSVWAAFVLIFGLMPIRNEFMLWILAGGGALIAGHLYSVVYRGEQSHGNLQLAALTPVFLCVTNGVLSYVNSITPVTYDALLSKWDLGIAAAVRNWSAWAIHPLSLEYDALPLFMALCVVISNGKPRKRLLTAIVIGSLVCPLFYFLFPAVGPAHVGDPLAPRNCMPSMHLTWTLLLWVYSQGTWKWFFGVIAFLTAWATLATGEHYSLDLVAAVLFTWGLVALADLVNGESV